MTTEMKSPSKDEKSESSRLDTQPTSTPSGQSRLSPYLLFVLDNYSFSKEQLAYIDIFKTILERDVQLFYKRSLNGYKFIDMKSLLQTISEKHFSKEELDNFFDKNNSVPIFIETYHIALITWSFTFYRELFHFIQSPTHSILDFIQKHSSIYIFDLLYFYHYIELHNDALLNISDYLIVDYLTEGQASQDPITTDTNDIVTPFNEIDDIKIQRNNSSNKKDFVMYSCLLLLFIF